MSLVIGLVLGMGVLLVWSSTWPQEKRAGREKPAVQIRSQRMVDTLRQAGIDRVTPRRMLLLCVVSGLLLALLTAAVTRIHAVMLCALVLGAWAPWGFVSWQARKRSARVRQLWPDAVDHLKSAIRAGLSLPEALIQLQYRGPEPLRPSFAAFASDYRASGEFDASLNRLKERMADPVADTIIEALKVTREVGGTDLGHLLGTLSEFLRENARTRSELEARQSWTVNAARLAICAPWVVLLLMSSQPAALKAYNSPAGYIVMIGGAGISLLAYRLMLRIGALPQERRVLQ